MQVILHTPAEIPFKGATVAKGTNYGSKEIELKHSNITHVLSRGEYFESQKITNTTQLTDHMPPLPRYSPFPTRTIPSKKINLFTRPLFQLYVSLLKPRSKYLLLTVSRIYFRNYSYFCRLLINLQNCSSFWGCKSGALLQIYIYICTYVYIYIHFL